jgi:hypothetical protein
MTAAQRGLIVGSIKSAVSSATALVLALPQIDPSSFSTITLKGWGHLGIAILAVVIVGEARFWNQWASSGNGPASAPPAAT